ncbi:fimbrial protein [Pseudomonas aeruginosa]
MRRIFQLLLFCFVALLPIKESFAMKCYDKNNPNNLKQYDSIPRISVAPQLAAGEVIYRSRAYTTVVECWQDSDGPAENAYIYLNIDDHDGKQLGEEIELGLELDGRDYKCSELGYGNFCRKILDEIYFDKKCENPKGCPDIKKSTTVTYRYFIAKKRKAQGGLTGNVTNAKELTAIQFNGSLGVNNKGGNYSIYLTNLGNLQYVGCASTVDIDPRLIEFNPVNASRVKKGSFIQDIPFRINVAKNCSAPYGLSGNFRPESGALADNDTTLVPLNNSSVGIQILDMDRDSRGVVVPFRQDFELAPERNTEETILRQFSARLLWMSDQAAIGAFNASAQLEVYYK